MASCLDSDNSWVLAGSESLPVETLGPASRMDPESERALQAPHSPSKADGEELAGTMDGEGTLFQTESPQSGSILTEETEVKGTLEGDVCGVEPPGPGDTVVQGGLQETTVVTGLGPDTQDLEGQSPPQSLPSTPKAAWIREEGRCSSSEDDTDVDMEGLRRRRGREAGPPQPMAPLAVENQAGGGLSESETGPMEEVERQVLPDPELLDALGDRQDGLREQLQASVPPDSVPSLQNMGLLLDKLAKENQDIRLLQAQLQVGIGRRGWARVTHLGQVSVLASSPKRNVSYLPTHPDPPLSHCSQGIFPVLGSYPLC
ncbi:PBXIP1 isoform 4 [Pongo abelii]|uniref:PBXIP1 isoform 4 n=1 Tax=Pongo abelii TaxID=9601 RepID=A0A2J8VG28_PONAB|nr:PBXIP1 isoform 4 [Pongo abelii]